MEETNEAIPPAKKINDFCVETKGYCFLCLSKILDEGYLDFYSFHLISSYLKLDKTKVFNKNVPIPPHLMALVMKSHLKVELCKGCVGLTRKFSEVHGQLEKIKMEMSFCLREIHGKLSKAEKEGRARRFRENAAQELSLDLEKVNIVERVRSETLQKCSDRLNGTPPQVLIPKVNATGGGNNLESASAASPNPIIHTEESKTGRDCPKTINYVAKDGTKYQFPAHLTKKQIRDRIYMQKKRKGMLGQGSSSSKSAVVVDTGDRSLASILQNATKQSNGMLKCRICSKTYLTRQHFKAHFEMVHITERKYECEYCHKRFKQDSHLKVHRNSIHLGQVFLCICNNKYPTKSHLVVHQRKCKQILADPSKRVVVPNGRARGAGRPKRQQLVKPEKLEELQQEEPFKVNVKLEPGLEFSSAKYVAEDEMVGDYTEPVGDGAATLENGYPTVYYPNGEEEERQNETLNNFVDESEEICG